MEIALLLNGVMGGSIYKYSGSSMSGTDIGVGDSFEGEDRGEERKKSIRQEKSVQPATCG